MTAPLSLRAFLDAANRLNFVDKAEFYRAVSVIDDGFQWVKFSANPIRWLVRAPDAEAEAVWRIAQQQDRGTG